MKKRILSLVLCAALLLSLCLFMGAGVAADAPATEDFVPAVRRSFRQMLRRRTTPPVLRCSPRM